MPIIVSGRRSRRTSDVRSADRPRPPWAVSLLPIGSREEGGERLSLTKRVIMGGDYPLGLRTVGVPGWTDPKT